MWTSRTWGHRPTCLRPLFVTACQQPARGHSLWGLTWKLMGPWMGRGWRAGGLEGPVPSPGSLLQFADGVYLVLLMGLLEGYFVPLHSFFLTPDSFEQKVRGGPSPHAQPSFPYLSWDHLGKGSGFLSA